MTIKIIEYNNDFGISITPENMEEVSRLFRLTKNTKRAVPRISISFSEHNNAPQLHIYMQKKSAKNRITSITN